MTPSKEDYLKAILQLGGNNTRVSNKDLVKELGVSAASVTDMNSRLLEEGFITYKPYHGVKITERGIKVANQLVRKHRIWEVFLAEKLNFDWDEVHTEADRLEHASSDEVIERLYKYLGEPETDPHGGKIPSTEKIFERISRPLLSEMKVNDSFILREVDDEPELLNYLNNKGIKLNETYKLIDKNEYEETLILTGPENKTVVLNDKVSQQIGTNTVEEIK